MSSLMRQLKKAMTDDICEDNIRKDEITSHGIMDKILNMDSQNEEKGKYYEIFRNLRFQINLMDSRYYPTRILDGLEWVEKGRLALYEDPIAEDTDTKTLEWVEKAVEALTDLQMKIEEYKRKKAFRQFSMIHRDIYRKRRQIYKETLKKLMIKLELLYINPHVFSKRVQVELDEINSQMNNEENREFCTDEEILELRCKIREAIRAIESLLHLSKTETTENVKMKDDKSDEKKAKRIVRPKITYVIKQHKEGRYSNGSESKTGKEKNNRSSG